METIREWAGLIKDVGFPIGVAIYLLYRFDGLLRDLTKAVSELKVTVESHNRPSV